MDGVDENLGFLEIWGFPQNIKNIDDNNNDEKDDHNKERGGQHYMKLAEG